MRGLLMRLFWTPFHVAWSCLVLALLCTTRRRAILVFTHFRDIVDARDTQMGPLVDELSERGEKFVELTLIPFGFALIRNLVLKRRLFVSHTAVLALAWFGSFGSAARTKRNRRIVSRWLLRALRPRVVYLIDESGSGQPLLLAARELGIPVVGVQHGAFVGSRQYDATLSASFDVVAVDTLCVWSEWYGRRLCAVSPIYDASNVRVTGRLRHAPAPGSATTPARPRVLVIGERDTEYRDMVQPFLAALTAGGYSVRWRTHPAERRNHASDSAADALRDHDIVIGSGSSALLEALYFERPVVILCSASFDDPASFAREGLAWRCETPGELVERCGRLLRDPSTADFVRRARTIVWGDASGKAASSAKAILAVGDELVAARGAADCDKFSGVSRPYCAPRKEP